MMEHFTLLRSLSRYHLQAKQLEPSRCRPMIVLISNCLFQIKMHVIFLPCLRKHSQVRSQISFYKSLMPHFKLADKKIIELNAVTSFRFLST